MMLRTVRTLVLGALALSLVAVVPASADQWNDRTILTFSSPVMVPGATLPAGSYVFKLADSASGRSVVQILRKDDNKLITTTSAVPTKRLNPVGDAVVKFSPTDRGEAPALRAWFYPNSVFGHEFIYPEGQAKQIAERTKTIVLSSDVPGTDASGGVLRTYGPDGKVAEYHGDQATLREWDAWRKDHHEVRSAPQSEAAATAPLVRGDFQGTRVKLDDLEANTSQYFGKTISVDGEVENVLGPRLFTIDEANHVDLDKEILVFMPSVLAAMVRDDDQVTVTGKVQRFVKADVEREWGWLGLDPKTEIEISRKPVLVATRIVGGTDNVALIIEAPKPGTPVGTSGTAAAPAVTDAAAIAGADEHMVGRHVDLKNLRVTGTAQDGGFFVQSGDHQVFVLPANREATTVKSGDTINLDGVVLSMPDGMEHRLKPSGEMNDDIYIFAMRIG